MDKGIKKDAFQKSPQLNVTRPKIKNPNSTISDDNHCKGWCKFTEPHHIKSNGSSSINRIKYEGNLNSDVVHKLSSLGCTINADCILVSDAQLAAVKKLLAN
ncbi:MAG: hypothetical protein ACI4EL_01660 [Candidatus Fimimorpha sp.]